MHGPTPWETTPGLRIWLEGQCRTGLAGGGEQLSFSQHQKPLQLGGDGKTAGVPLVTRTEGTHGAQGHENIGALQDLNQNSFTDSMKKRLWLLLQLSQSLLHVTLTSRNFIFLNA